MKITAAEFVTAAVAPAGWPREALPEAAFAGRSNVGKSSLINCLVNRKGLARTSATPGRTRQIVFFRVNARWLFADLPGYGYARVSQAERQSWQGLVEDYLSGRENLRGVVLILDARRGPEAEERDLIGWLTARGIPFLPVATKADKLSPGERREARERIARELGLAPDRVPLFSARTREGRDEVWKEILAFFR